MLDVLDSFREALACTGIDYSGEIIADGRLHRFRAEGDHRPNGWYYLHADDRPFGEFGHHAKGLDRVRWRPSDQRAPTAAERARWEHQRRQREAQTRQRIEAALVNLARDWSRAEIATAHPYLASKGVAAHGLRTLHENLLVPMRDSGGALRSLQEIASDGVKRYRKHLPTRALYHAIGKPCGCIVIAEGYATAASIHECTGHAVAVAFDCANLAPVAGVLHAKYPKLPLIIAADNDASGAGQTGARLAAEAAGAEVRMPELVGEDWNDVALRAGADVMRAVFPLVTAEHLHAA